MDGINGIASSSTQSTSAWTTSSSNVITEENISSNTTLAGVMPSASSMTMSTSTVTPTTTTVLNISSTTIHSPNSPTSPQPTPQTTSMSSQTNTLNAMELNSTTTTATSATSTMRNNTSSAVDLISSVPSTIASELTMFTSSVTTPSHTSRTSTATRSASNTAEFTVTDTNIPISATAENTSTDVGTDATSGNMVLMALWDYLIFNLMTLTFYDFNKIFLYFHIIDLKCTWSMPTAEVDVMKCNDGSYCNIEVAGWPCCNNKGGRAKCPKNYPNMCIDKVCSNNTDHCCAVDGFCEENAGGIRPCLGK